MNDLENAMRKLNLTGRKFSRLTVIKEVASPEKDSHWLCQCDCGNIVEIRGTAIKSGTTKSCGCLAKDTARNIVVKGNLKQRAEIGYENKRVDGVATFLINEKIQKNNKSGYNGVRAYKLASGRTKYMAYLTVGKKRYSKRGFEKAMDAYKYRLELVKKYVPKKGDKNEI